MFWSNNQRSSINHLLLLIRPPRGNILTHQNWCWAPPNLSLTSRLPGLAWFVIQQRGPNHDMFHQYCVWVQGRRQGESLLMFDVGVVLMFVVGLANTDWLTDSAGSCSIWSLSGNGIISRGLRAGRQKHNGDQSAPLDTHPSVLQPPDNHAILETGAPS